MINAPVLVERVRRGETITDKDLSYVKILNRDVHANMIIDAQDLIGMTPRRTLASNQIILDTDITSPILVKRNDIINVTLKNGAIQLSTKARAVSDGAKGDVVQIMNPTSKKIIEAVVIGPQQAVVDANLNG